MSTDYLPYLNRYVEGLKASGALRSADVERAFRVVPRHLFVRRFFDPRRAVPTLLSFDPYDPSPAFLEMVYSDQALVTDLQDGRPSSSASQPSLVARMLELLELRSGMRVMEIGTGTGYQAALMAAMIEGSGSLVTLDVSPELASAARVALADGGCVDVCVEARDGYYGAPERAPFDRIIATVGCPDLAPAWIEQLDEEASLLIPLEHARHHPLVRVWKGPEGIYGRIVHWTGFVPISGRLADARLTETRHIPRDDWSRLQEQGLIRQRELWPGYTPGSPLPGTPLGARALDFYLFLWLENRRTQFTPWGFGLAGPDGWALVDGDKICSYGAARHARDLDKGYASWQALGAPTISDYELQFIAVDGDEQRRSPTTKVLDRLFFKELLRINAA